MMRTFISIYCVTKDEGTVTYFDSYGKPVDHALTYASKTAREELGETHKYLSQLFNRAPEEVVYNPINYQSEDPEVNTCGRHCVFFILNNIKRGLTLSQYYQLMKNLKKKMGSVMTPLSLPIFQLCSVFIF